MSRFFPLEVDFVRQETEDCVCIQFRLASDQADHFKFSPGQHLTLKKDIDGQEIRRSYSICSGPEEGHLRIAIKQVEGGQFSTFANLHLKSGDIVEAMPPTGSFQVSYDSDQGKTYLMIAAGSGITPIISNIKAILAREKESRVVLLYGNRDSNSVIFLEEIEGLKNTYLNRLSIHHFFSRESLENDLFQGRITAQKLEDLKKTINYDSIDEVFICGPEELMKEASAQLQKIGLPESKIHTELFTSPVGKLGTSDQRKVSAVKSKITIIMDGIKHEIPFESKESILEVANKKGTELPFSCKGGVCSTCKAKLLEGEVEMDVNYALEEDEMNAGYILTCQAHPVSQQVTISFDQG